MTKRPDSDPFNVLLASIIKKGVPFVDCASMKVTDDDVITLIAAMESSPITISAIRATGNQLTSAGAKKLAAYALKNPLEQVLLDNNQIGDDGIMAFLPVLCQASHPTIFTLSRNPCSDNVVVRLEFLAKRESFDKTVQDALIKQKATLVSFAGARYSDIDTRLIRYLLTSVQGVQCLDLTSTNAGDNGVHTIGEIAKISTAKEYRFRGCGLSPSGIENFSAAADLPHHRYIETLDFGDNYRISEEFAKRIPSLIFDENCVITQFKLDGTGVLPETQKLVADEGDLNKQPAALKKAVVAVRQNSPASKDVCLQWETPMNECVRFLYRQIARATVIESLNISNSGITDDDLHLLSRALRHNTSLRKLEIANNNFTATGLTELFDVIREGACNIEEVNLANNNLNAQSGGAIVRALRENPKLKRINVDVNPELPRESLLEIGGLSVVNRAPDCVRLSLPSIETDDRTLRELDFSGSHVALNDEHVLILCRALATNTCIKTVNLSHNVIGDRGIMSIAELLAKNPAIEELNLSANSITGRGATQLCESLYENRRLRVLDLSNNYIESDNVVGFLPLLRKNHVLLRVNLEQTRVVPEAALAIQRACDLNRDPPQAKEIFYRLEDKDTTLTEIVLSRKKLEWALDDVSLKTLCANLRGQKYVRVLRLDGNNFTSASMPYLADVIADPECDLRRIIIDTNPIDDEGVAVLTRVIADNKTISDVWMSNCTFTNAGVACIVECLKRNSNICNFSVSEDRVDATLVNRWLSINSQPQDLKTTILRLESAPQEVEEIENHGTTYAPFGDEACNLLSATLMKNTFIKTLVLHGNQITSAAVPALVDVIKSCPNLTYVDVSHNQIDATGGALLVDCAQQCRNLTFLNISGNKIPEAQEKELAHLMVMNQGSPLLKRLQLQFQRGVPLDSALDFNGEHTGHRLNDEEMRKLAKMLAKSDNIVSLDLSNNDITDVGCAVLGCVLRANHSIQVLDLRNNASIGLNGGAALFYALKVNPILKTLFIDGTNIPKETQEDLDSLLHINQTELRERMDLRNKRLMSVDEQTLFFSTDYFLSQNEAIDEDLSGEGIRYLE